MTDSGLSIVVIKWVWLIRGALLQMTLSRANERTRDQLERYVQIAACDSVSGTSSSSFIHLHRFSLSLSKTWTYLHECMSHSFTLAWVMIYRLNCLLILSLALTLSLESWGVSGGLMLIIWIPHTHWSLQCHIKLPENYDGLRLQCRLSEGPSDDDDCQINGRNYICIKLTFHPGNWSLDSPLRWAATGLVNVVRFSHWHGRYWLCERGEKERDFVDWGERIMMMTMGHILNGL